LLRCNVVASIATEDSGRGEVLGVRQVTQKCHLVAANVAFAARFLTLRIGGLIHFGFWSGAIDGGNAVWIMRYRMGRKSEIRAP
jgi:hypothetical protein